jgi:hypothetical protein
MCLQCQERVGRRAVGGHFIWSRWGVHAMTCFLDAHEFNSPSLYILCFEAKLCVSEHGYFVQVWIHTAWSDYYISYCLTWLCLSNSQLHNRYSVLVQVLGNCCSTFCTVLNSVYCKGTMQWAEISISYTQLKCQMSVTTVYNLTGIAKSSGWGG